MGDLRLRAHVLDQSGSLAATLPTQAVAASVPRVRGRDSDGVEGCLWTQKIFANQLVTEKGESPSQIAGTLGANEETVSYHLRRVGLPLLLMWRSVLPATVE
jgi:hypothetical protein